MVPWWYHPPITDTESNNHTDRWLYRQATESNLTLFLILISKRRAIFFRAPSAHAIVGLFFCGLGAPVYRTRRDGKDAAGGRLGRGGRRTLKPVRRRRERRCGRLAFFAPSSNKPTQQQRHVAVNTRYVIRSGQSVDYLHRVRTGLQICNGTR